MDLVSRAFRGLAALLIALPLGQGGICCCVFGDHAAASSVIAAETAHSCCPEAPAGETGPASSSKEGDDCGCPMRDSVVLAPTPGETVGAPTAITLSAEAPIPAADGILAPALAPAAHAVAPAPVPKTPLYRTHCVLLC